MQAEGLSNDSDGISIGDIFLWLDRDADGHIGEQQVHHLVRLETDNSAVLYCLDSVALGAFAVIGAQHGISRGLPPAICITSGVTICFGGIIRDLLCHRHVAFGSQSYAMATGCGAFVYVAARQLVVRGWPIP